MKNNLKNSLALWLTWGAYIALSMLNPYRFNLREYYLYNGLRTHPPLFLALDVLISVILVTVACMLILKLVFKKPVKLWKVLAYAVVFKAILVFLQYGPMWFGFRNRMLVKLVPILNLLYPILCATLSMGVNRESEEEKTTLYRKKRIIQKGSAAEKLLNYVYIYFWGLGIICTIGGFIVRPRSQAPVFFSIGVIFLVLAWLWTKRKIEESRIENYQKIVTPAHWPKDCQYENYNAGLNRKVLVIGNSKDLRFYESCVAEGITDMNSARNKQKAILIAQRQKMKDTAEAAVIAAFESGRKLKQANDSQTADHSKNQELQAIRIKELDVLAGAMRYYGLHGREKRIAMLKDMYADAKEKMKDAKFMQEYSQRTMLKKEHDWAVHGGIASGIAGPAAGIVTAMQIEAKNAAIRQYNAQMAPYAMMVSDSYSNTAKGYEQMMDRYTRDINQTGIKLVGEDSTQEIYKHIRISNMNYAISETGAVAVEADFDIDPNYRIFEEVEPAIDGVVAARLMENGVHAGTAYFVFPVDGVHKKVRLASICTKTIKPEAVYTVEYQPVDLWAIEKL